MKTKILQMNKIRNSGFIALISAIIVSAILLGFTLTIGANSFHTRFNTINSEYKRISLGLAESCINSALLKINQNYYYGDSSHGYGLPVNGEVVTVGTNTCTIKSVSITSSNSSSKTVNINTEASYNGAFSSVATSATATNPANTTPRATLFITVNQTTGGLIHVSGSNPNPSTPFTDSVQGTTVTIDANSSYSVSEDNVSGYTTTPGSTCSSVSGLSQGQTQSCVITNTQTPTTGTITITANVTNSNGTGHKGPNDFPLYINDVAKTAGQPYTYNPSQGPFVFKADNSDTNYTISSWGYDCSGAYNNGALNSNLLAGQNKTCVINYQDVPPPTPQCAETVMMLDRTGTFFQSNAESYEEAAADSLLNLYSTLAILPKVGVGSFGGLYNSAKALIPDGSAGQPLSGLMTTSYGTQGSTNNPTSALSPSTTNSPSWTNNGASGEINDSNFATDSTNGHIQGYGGFGLSVPSNAQVTGIEVYADGKVSGNSPQTPVTIYPTNTGNYNSWTANGNNNKVTDVNNTDASDTTYINTSTNNSAQTYVLPNANIPANASTISVSFYAIARGTSSGSSIKLRLENSTSGGHQWDDGGHNLTTNYATYQYNNATQNTNPATGQAWTANDVNTWGNNGGLRFGIMRTNSAAISPRVTQMYATINYSLPATGGVGVQLWNTSTNSWTSTKSVSFTTSESNQLVSSSANPSVDTWSKTWSSTDFNNFKIQIVNNSATGVTTSLNYTTVKVYYTLPTTGLYALIHAIDANQSSVGTWQDQAMNVTQAELSSARHVVGKNKVMIMVSDGVISNGPTSAQILTAANNAKNSGIQIFGMHFGSSSGTANFLQWVSPSIIPNSTITSTGAKRSGTTVTITTSSAHGLFTNQDVTISGITGSGSCSSLNGTYAIITIPSTTTFTYTSTSSGTLNCGNGTVKATDLFEAPNASEMPNVFNSIGEQACPALNPATTAAPTTATINVVTHVVNNNLGTWLANNFTVHITGSTLNPSINDFSGVESPGQSVTVNPGNFSIDETGSIGSYTKTLGVGCSGTATAGQNLLCTITDDDLPQGNATTVVPATNIDIGSWQETP